MKPQKFMDTGVSAASSRRCVGHVGNAAVGEQLDLQGLMNPDQMAVFHLATPRDTVPWALTVLRSR